MSTGNGMTSEALRLKGFKEVAGGRFERVKGASGPSGGQSGGQSGAQSGLNRQPEDKAVASRRVRQSSKPPTKIESDWLAHLEAIYPGVKIRSQAIRFRLANGSWYKCDHSAWISGRLHCWETKGPSQMRGMARGMLTIKVAAAIWPEVLFTLVWRDNDGQWKQQEILS